MNLRRSEGDAEKKLAATMVWRVEPDESRTIVE
jgi:hypothetical protein